MPSSPPADGARAPAATTPRALPPGRHRLSRETVSASQRDRLLDAAIRCSAEHGYARVTISHIVGHAHVARRTFYEHFESKEACFLAAYDHTAEEIIIPLLAAFSPSGNVHERADGYVSALLGALAARPALARMLLVEVAAGGPAALQRRRQMSERLARAIVELNARTRRRRADVPAMSSTRALAIVGALEEPMRVQLLSHGAARLPELRAELTAVLASLVAIDLTPEHPAPAGAPRR